MNILNIEHVSKMFGEKVIFDDVSYGIHQGDKIGIIGINGTGKTTILKIIAGLEEPDEGQVITQNGLRITYLPQNPEFPSNATILDYVADGKWQKDWATASEAANVLNKLGITDHEEKIEHLSGGQKKRVALARTLVNPADVLILDEPTNHIDNEMAAWLEDYLQKFKGALIMVTHDRYFLDRVTNKILEISHGKLYSYEANYSKFLELKAQREEMELAGERKRQSVLRMDSVETRMGKKTIELHHVSKSFGEKKVVDDFTYIILRNQRLGIIGPNGCGKSTFMKMIAGILKPDAGEIEWGDTIKTGYGQKSPCH